MPIEQDPLELAARALRHRDRSRHAVDVRLARAGIDDAARVEALVELERIGYVDDHRFARSRVASLVERGYGDAAIRADLEQQGVDRHHLADALSELEPEYVRAAAAIERLGRSPRTGAQLMRKGFSPDVVQEALGTDGGADDP